jgi:hypothetical protein
MPSLISIRGSQFVKWSTSDCIICCYRPIPFTELHQEAELRDNLIRLNMATDAGPSLLFPSTSEHPFGSPHEIHDIDLGIECSFQLSRVTNAITFCASRAVVHCNRLHLRHDCSLLDLEKKLATRMLADLQLFDATARRRGVWQSFASKSAPHSRSVARTSTMIAESVRPPALGPARWNVVPFFWIQLQRTSGVAGHPGRVYCARAWSIAPFELRRRLAPDYWYARRSEA